MPQNRKLICTTEDAQSFLLKKRIATLPLGEQFPSIDTIKILEEIVVDGAKYWRYFIPNEFGIVATRNETYLSENGDFYSIFSLCKHSIEDVILGLTTGPHHDGRNCKNSPS